jgi:hypothetical protein
MSDSWIRREIVTQEQLNELEAKSYQENAKRVLEALVPAILNIDMGCTPCIKSYIHDANQVLDKAGYRYGFGYVEAQDGYGDEYEPHQVLVVPLPDLF